MLNYLSFLLDAQHEWRCGRIDCAAQGWSVRFPPVLDGLRGGIVLRFGVRDWNIVQLSGIPPQRRQLNIC